MTRQLKILQWNARSLYGAKLAQFKVDLSQMNPDIVLISETFWRDEYKVCFKAYTVFNKNRTDRRGGGVAILIKNYLRARPITIPYSQNIEAVGAAIQVGPKQLGLVSVYCPKGECNVTELTEIWKAAGTTAITGGDMNAHSGLWEQRGTLNRAGSAVEDALAQDDNTTLSTPPNLGTRRGTGNTSTIDLTFSTRDIAPAVSITRGPLDWDSDHIPIKN